MHENVDFTELPQRPDRWRVARGARGLKGGLAGKHEAAEDARFYQPHAKQKAQNARFFQPQAKHTAQNAPVAARP
jgi:hypothetical protein